MSNDVSKKLVLPGVTIAFGQMARPVREKAGKAPRPSFIQELKQAFDDHKNGAYTALLVSYKASVNKYKIAPVPRGVSIWDIIHRTNNKGLRVVIALDLSSGAPFEKQFPYSTGSNIRPSDFLAKPRISIPPEAPMCPAIIRNGNGTTRVAPAHLRMVMP